MALGHFAIPAELELEAAAGEELEAAETEEMPDAVPAEAASEMPEDGHSKNTVVGGGVNCRILIWERKLGPAWEEGGYFVDAGGAPPGTTRAR